MRTRLSSVQPEERGRAIAATKPRDNGSVINLMDALRKSLDDGSKANAARNAKQAKEVEARGQREMLMSIPGKGQSTPNSAAKEPKRSSRQRKAG